MARLKSLAPDSELSGVVASTKLEHIINELLTKISESLTNKLKCTSSCYSWRTGGCSERSRNLLRNERDIRERQPCSQFYGAESGFGF